LKNRIAQKTRESWKKTQSEMNEDHYHMYRTEKRSAGDARAFGYGAQDSEHQAGLALSEKEKYTAKEKEQKKKYDEH